LFQVLHDRDFAASFKTQVYFRTHIKEETDMDQNQLEMKSLDNKPMWTKPEIAMISLNTAKSGGMPPHAHDGTGTRS
jgi:hypothetical protein